MQRNWMMQLRNLHYHRTKMSESLVKLEQSTIMHRQLLFVDSRSMNVVNSHCVVVDEKRISLLHIISSFDSPNRR